MACLDLFRSHGFDFAFCLRFVRVLFFYVTFLFGRSFLFQGIIGGVLWFGYGIDLVKWYWFVWFGLVWFLFGFGLYGFVLVLVLV